MDMTQTHEEKHSQIMAIELILAKCLRIGSVIAAILMGAGILTMVSGVSASIGQQMVTGGLIVLLGTPVMRVTVAGLVFIKEKDWRFAFFCLVVLCALTAGVVLGGLGD